MKNAGLEAVTKKKKPLVTKNHRRETISHQYWILEDWKKVVWLDETKINHPGSDGKKCVWKKKGEGLSNRLVEGTMKLGGGSAMLWDVSCGKGCAYHARLIEE